MAKISVSAASLLFSVMLTGCSGGSNPPSVTLPPPPPPLPSAPVVSVDVEMKQLIFSWDAVPGATTYRLLENADGSSGFTRFGSDLAAGTLSVIRPIAVHLHDFDNALYVVEACNVSGCTGSTAVHAMNRSVEAIASIVASNSEIGDGLSSVALSADGKTLAVGSIREDSSATGVDGNKDDNSVSNSGAVYLFRLEDNDWKQQAYIKASNTHEEARFGRSLAISADGNTLVVGTPGEDLPLSDIHCNQDPSNGFLGGGGAGAAYVFRFDGANWSEQAYILASSPGMSDFFGGSVALSADGKTLAVGATLEDSSSTGINGDECPDNWEEAGAVYVYQLENNDWVQQAYIKASNAGSFDDEEGDEFGSSIALSADGNTLAVGATEEESNATGINGDQDDNSFHYAGAAYVFRFDGTDWAQQAYIKASNTGRHGDRDDDNSGDRFGWAVALSADGNTLAVGAPGEDSSATGIDGDQDNDLSIGAGAAYVFRFSNNAWEQQAYVKASNTKELAQFGEDHTPFFGRDLALSADGNTLAVGAPGEDSGATGINGDQNDDSSIDAGAVYVFQYDGTAWSQKSYVKAPNGVTQNAFGFVDLSGDGETLAVKARGGVFGLFGFPNSIREGTAYIY